MGSGLYHAVRPTAPHELHEPLLAAGYRCSPLPTIVVDLTPTPEALWSRLDKKTRNGIRKGLKVGVEVSPADDWAAWEQFLELQHRHAASHGLAALGPDHCRYYFEVLRAAGACRLFIARLGSELACGMLFIIGEGTMRYFISCSRSDMLHCSPNDPTMWHAIRWGHASGLRWLDLYDTDPRPGSPLAGIHHFKSRWGGALVDRPYYIRGALYHWLRERKREAAGRGLMFRLLQRAGA
jgi:lipid II:glycine glycyltransferase (peptidoglycan interpeptide bridge formation enzyme)